MLLIWDIHITSKMQGEILDGIASFINAKKEEKNLIFLGDFVYHFSYDRGALLSLFELFLQLYKQGKHLYILAGNHDRLGNNFVYEEGKQVFDLLQKQETAGKIFFITEPWLTELEGEKILFLPYMLDLDEAKYPAFAQGQSLLTQALLQSKDKNEVMSGKINQLVQSYLRQEENLTLIHHYYTNKVQFPGYRSSFSFKDVALSEQFLDEAGLKLISGHLHAPFVFKNYLCTGSVWATSPLETNQLKWFWTYHHGLLGFQSLQLRNYLQLEQQISSLWRAIPVWEEAIRGQYQFIVEELKSQFKTAQETQEANQHCFALSNFELEELDLKKTILNLKVATLDYEKVDEVLEPSLREKISDFRLKKTTQKVDDLLEKMKKPDESSLQTFGGWKELLKNYLQMQYGSDYPQYEAILRELKVL